MDKIRLSRSLFIMLYENYFQENLGSITYNVTKNNAHFNLKT